MKGQLTLRLEPEAHGSLEEPTRAELIKALADLLLEAYGADSSEAALDQGGGHESEDH